jgi:hypothetical protein
MKKTVHSIPHLVSMYDRISIATCTFVLGLASIYGLAWFRESVISEAGRTSVAAAIVVMFGFTVVNSFSTLLGRRDNELARLKQQLRAFLKIA